MANTTNAEKLLDLIRIYKVGRADIAEFLSSHGFPGTNKKTIDSWLAPADAKCHRGKGIRPNAGLTNTKLSMIAHWMDDNFEPQED